MRGAVGATFAVLGLIGVSVVAFGAPKKQNVLTDPEDFPIAVWLQSPENAKRYQAAGINLYVGLW